jgi:hypothetical protein
LLSSAAFDGVGGKAEIFSGLALRGRQQSNTSAFRPFALTLHQ